VTGLSAAHRSVLEAIGISGIDPAKMLRNGREFEELERHGLIVFLPLSAARSVSTSKGCGFRSAGSRSAGRSRALAALSLAT
jgi:hypothetical protein